MALILLPCASAEELPLEKLHSDSQWQNVNEQFLDSYAQEKHFILANLGPVLVCGHGQILLMNGSERKAIPIKAPLHDHLKTSDHEVLELYILLKDKAGHPLNALTLDRLRLLQLSLEKTKTTFAASTAMSNASKRNAVDLMDRTLVFIKAVLKDQIVSKTDLYAFTRSVGNSALENAYFAMKGYLADLDKKTQELLCSVPLSEQSRLHVIVYESHMAQKDNAEVQYFDKLLNDSGEGMRVIFCDQSYTEEKALDSLATHMLDATIGESFFGDPWRMHRDLRADAAKRALSEMDIKAIGH